MGFSYWAGYVIAMIVTVALMLSPALIFTRRGRSLWLPRIQRHRAGRRARAVVMQQARRDARTAQLEAELDQFDTL